VAEALAAVALVEAGKFSSEFQVQGSNEIKKTVLSVLKKERFFIGHNLPNLIFQYP
jgi:hypothetical protein